jgi:hypothetical protein
MDEWLFNHNNDATPLPLASSAQPPFVAHDVFQPVREPVRNLRGGLPQFASIPGGGQTNATYTLASTLPSTRVNSPVSMVPIALSTRTKSSHSYSPGVARMRKYGVPTGNGTMRPYPIDANSLPHGSPSLAAHRALQPTQELARRPPVGRQEFAGSSGGEWANVAYTLANTIDTHTHSPAISMPPISLSTGAASGHQSLSSGIAQTFEYTVPAGAGTMRPYPLTEPQVSLSTSRTATVETIPSTDRESLSATPVLTASPVPVPVLVAVESVEERVSRICHRAVVLHLFPSTGDADIDDLVCSARSPSKRMVLFTFNFLVYFHFLQHPISLISLLIEDVFGQKWRSSAQTISRGSSTVSFSKTPLPLSTTPLNATQLIPKLRPPRRTKPKPSLIGRMPKN